MKYISTRGKAAPVLFSEALRQGLPPDGGLYIPEVYPSFTGESLAKLLPAQIFQPWLAGDPLQEQLSEICKTAFDFPAPLTFLNDHTAVLELYHGPTAAFKDFGAKFLAACFERIPRLHPGTVLVATSGDTGGAVASAFFRKPGLQVVILYPKDKISPLQECQLTTWGENIKAIAVRGTFDDCQKLVLAALKPPTVEQLPELFSANSINLGRLLPQTSYYASSSLSYLKKTGKAPGYIIPTGNLGNAVAALWAKKMGFPIREVVLATNSNLTLLNYFKSGTWTPRPSIKTLANAMDVGNPNNIERLNHLYPDFQALKKEVRVLAVNDKEIAQTIQESSKQNQQIYCPHTATAVFAAKQLPGDWILVSTAHPAKFNEVLEPLVGRPLALPANLALLLQKQQYKTEIEPALETLQSILLRFGNACSNLRGDG